MDDDDYCPEMSTPRDTHLCWAGLTPERNILSPCQNTATTSLGLCKQHDQEIRP